MEFQKKAQVTIFIVLAIVIVVSIGFIYLFLSGNVTDVFKGKSDEMNPNIYLENNLKRDVFVFLEDILPKGGDRENKLSIEFEFKGEPLRNISLLCYTQDNYLPCINQRPLLIKHVEKEMKEGLRGKYNSVFDEMEKNFDSNGYDVFVKRGDYNFRIVPGRIILDVNSEINLAKGEERINHRDIKVVFPSKTYEILELAQEIIGQQARYCSFQTRGYMLLYPEFDIREYRTMDSNIIYTIIHKDTKEKFRFAVRSCVI